MGAPASRWRRQEAPQPSHAFDFVYLVGDTLFELLVEFGEFLRLHFQLSSSLAQFSEQSLIFNGNDCLGGEVCDHRDLFIREGTDFYARHDERTDQFVLL